MLAPSAYFEAIGLVFMQYNDEYGMLQLVAQAFQQALHKGRKKPPRLMGLEQGLPACHAHGLK